MATDKFIVAVISPFGPFRDQATSIFEKDGRVEALWSMADYPGPAALSQIRDARGGCVIFLDFADIARAKTIAAELDNSYPMAATVAVHLPENQPVLTELMQLGIREVVALPTTAAEIERAFQRASRKLGRESETEEPPAEIFAFLPARPGTGATTVAAHSAAAASRLGDGRTLLIDFDFRLGMTSFLFKLHGEHSVLDALALGDQLDDTLWDQLVGQHGSLEILGSAPMEFEKHAPLSHSGALLDFAARRYRTICVDLPGEMREHELETLHRAKEIFLVCTPELGTLHMAKRKSQMLQALELQNRVSVVLNPGHDRGSIGIADVEQVLQLPVRFTLPSAEREIFDATQKAVAIQGKSPIAVQFEKIARRMIGEGIKIEGKAKAKPQRLIKFFSATPVREKVGWKR